MTNPGMTKEEFKAAAKVHQSMATELYRDIAHLKPIEQWSIAMQLLAFVSYKSPKGYDKSIETAFVCLTTSRPPLPEELQ